MNRQLIPGVLCRIVTLACTVFWFVGCLPPRSQERIACHVKHRENSDVAYPATSLYVMDGDGSHRTRVGDGNQPSWSPDGSKLLFRGSMHRSIHLLDLGTGESTTLLEINDNLDGPAWSPDGTEIAFLVHSQRIWILNVDGSGARALTHFGDNPSVGRPSWSPTGAKIGFSVSTDGDHSDVYVMNRDGSDVVRLTDGAGDYASPIWSPTEDTIAFEQRDGEEWWVCVMNSDGSGEHCVAPGQLYGWSPDGTRIYFHMPFEDTLWTISRDGSNRTRLFELSCEDPAWSPAMEGAD
jgi:TolB protein